MGTGRPPLFGAARPFADEELRRLYPSRAEFTRRWDAAVDALVATGALRPEDAPGHEGTGGARRAAQVTLGPTGPRRTIRTIRTMPDNCTCPAAPGGRFPSAPWPASRSACTPASSCWSHCSRSREAPPGVRACSRSLVWLVLIFACVVFHELSHCLVGRRHGLVVHEIDLLPIGGVSRLESFPETPRDEFAMAIAGPRRQRRPRRCGCARGPRAFASALPDRLPARATAPAARVAQPVARRVQHDPCVPTRRRSRVLRSLLERRYDMARATQIAGRAGRLFALLLVGVGVVWNLWLVIIGIFVYFGASAEESATLIHLRLGGRRVHDAMLAPPTTIDAVRRRDCPAVTGAAQRSGSVSRRAAGALPRGRRRRRHRAGRARKSRRGVRRPHRSRRRTRRRPRERHPQASGNQRARGRSRRRRTRSSASSGWKRSTAW